MLLQYYYYTITILLLITITILLPTIAKLTLIFGWESFTDAFQQDVFIDYRWWLGDDVYFWEKRMGEKKHSKDAETLGVNPL
jgi:hypothetical protein